MKIKQIVQNIKIIEYRRYRRYRFKNFFNMERYINIYAIPLYNINNFSVNGHIEEFIYDIHFF